MVYKFHVDGLDCANCAQKLEDRINRLDSISEANVNFANMTIFTSSKRTEAEVMRSIQSIANQIEDGILIMPTKKWIRNVKPNPSMHTHEEECCLPSSVNKNVCEIQSTKEASLGNTMAFSIHGLDCGNCAMKVEDKIRQMDMVRQATVNFSTQTLQVQSNTTINEEEMMLALQNVIDSVEDGVEVSLKKGMSVIKKPKLVSLEENWSVLLGIVLLIVGVVLEKQSYSYLFLLSSYVIAGYKVLVKAIKNCMRLEIFDENFLMCIATIGALWIGEYKEAVAVMLFYSIGEIFQSFAVNKTRSSISSLMDIKSAYANVVIGEKIVKKYPEEVAIDDIVIIKVGEKIPLDGVVIKGTSTLDTSSLTGESLPRNVKEGEEVLAGVVNVTEILYVRVTKVYEDSTVSKILELIENAASKKAPLERFITRFAKVYTPTVVVLAVLLAIVPMFLFKDAVFQDWLYRALTFLVVSCPCALVISIPLGLYAGLGKASKMGVLIKGGNYLEVLKDINTVVFDKTGTLTKGSFEVIEINGNDDLLMYGAYGEYFSNHPIGKSIVAAYDNTIDVRRIQDFKEMVGKGIAVNIDSKKVFLGNQSYMTSLGIQVVEPNTMGTIVYVAIDNEYVGNIVVADTIKDSTIEGIKRLKSVGITNTVMLSGDHRNVATDIASKVGIDTVYSELLPQDKVHQVEALMQNKQCKLAFVGDGINDAPVLARADIGIAMGGIGSDAAIEASDIVLMNDAIDAISETIVVSKKTNRILKQNVTFTLVIKIGVLLFTMFGYSNMWMGVFADVGVTLIAILNAMRILK